MPRAKRKTDEEEFRGIQQEKQTTMNTIDPSEWNLDDSQEPYALPEGTECLLRIIEVRKAKRDDDTEYYAVRMEVPSEPYSKEIAGFLNIPDSKRLDAKRLNVARRVMLAFMECFSIDQTKLTNPIEDWPGREGWAILTMQNTDQYGEQNRIGKYVRAR